MHFVQTNNFKIFFEKVTSKKITDATLDQVKELVGSLIVKVFMSFACFGRQFTLTSNFIIRHFLKGNIFFICAP